MANREINVERWVDDHLAALAPASEWIPNTAKAWARLQEKRRERRVVLLRWIGASLAASVGSLALFLLPASRACAQQPGVCTQRVLATVFHEVPATRNFKEVGLASAPVTCEIFIDYQCPPCAKFLSEAVPFLEDQYVQTGKVKLLYRDFPLPEHRYATLAARYANAAGQLGYYDPVKSQIFKTQNAWSETGDIDSEVARALPPRTMQKLRHLVDEDEKLDASIAADVAAGQEDHLNQPPAAVIVYTGNRQLVPGNVTIDVLKSYLDQAVAH
jgi:protein-disulfide isomerase